jgi:hypothetical protein
VNLCRNGLHEIRSSADRRPNNGGCIHCSRTSQSRYQAQCRAARRRLAAIEAALA